MRVSLNQIEQTARKAARGGGLPWGLADEAGKAVRWLHTYGLNGAAALARWLERREDSGHREGAPAALSGVWRASDGAAAGVAGAGVAGAGALDPLLTGASLGDCAGRMRAAPVRTGAIAHPLLAAAFIGVAAEIEDLAFTLTWPEARLDCRRGGARVAGARQAVEVETTAFMECRRGGGGEEEPAEDWRAPRIGEVVISDGKAEAWACLERYAHRTYVEASETSRLAGAGAGLHDND